jgi:MATE family multidrug resistance protein
VQAVLIAILVPCRDQLGNLFSSDDDVAHLVSHLIPIAFVFMVGDVIQACTAGVLRGLGRQRIILLLNILGFWILALPIGSMFAFVAGLGVFGFW